MAKKVVKKQVKKQQDGIFMTKEGFFFGHLLENGKPSAATKRITEQQIMTMFMHMFSSYCAKSKVDFLIMNAGDYKVLAKEMPTEEGK